MSEKPPLLAMLAAPFIILYIKVLDLIDWIIHMDETIHPHIMQVPKKKQHNDKKHRDTINK